MNILGRAVESKRSPSPFPRPSKDHLQRFARFITNPSRSRSSQAGRSKRVRWDPHQNPFLVSFLVVFVLMALELLVWKPYYLTNDDVDGAFITGGLGFASRPDEHLYFSSVLLGLPLKWLFTWAPRVPWYGWAEILCEFTAFWSLLAALILRSFHRYTLPLFILTFFFAGPFFFCQLNFTMLALLNVLGAVLLAGSLGETPSRAFDRPVLALAGAALLLSSSLRIGAFGLGLMVLAPILFFLAQGKEWDRKRVGTLLGLGLMVLTGQGLDFLYYRMDPAWERFNRDYQVQSYYMVFGGFTYGEKTRPFFDEAGWSRNDLDLFQNIYYMDPQKYGRERIQRLANHMPSSMFRDIPERISGFLRTFRKTEPITTRNYLILFTFQNLALCVLFLGLLIPRGQGPRPWIQAGWVLACVLALVMAGRAPERLILPILFFLVAFGCWEARPDLQGWLPNRKGWMVPALLVLWTLLSFPTLFVYSKINRQYQVRDRALQEALWSLHSREDALYVVWAGHLPFEAVSALDSFDCFRGLHLFNISCFQGSPLAAEMLGRYGVQDPFRDLVDRKDLFLICHPDQKALYEKNLQERFGMKMRWEEAASNELFHLYRVHSAGPGPFKGL